MHKKYLIVLLVLTVPAWLYLLRPGYFSMHDDLQVMRLYQMDKCISDGQIPCRYSPDMVWGFGQAMFNYYSAFPYYLGTIFVKLSLSYIAAVKTLFLISLLGSGIGMYLLAREFWGDKGALFSALLYVYAPYHALDIYVRGALAESFSLMLLPFIWHGLYLMTRKRRWNYVLYTSVGLGLLLMTHNISLVMFAPFTAIWILYLLIKSKKIGLLIDYGISTLLAFGLAAFFLLPAFFERNLIQAELFIDEYYDFHAHFVSLRQLFLERSWGFGGSVFGQEDGMSFQIGWFHSIAALAAGFLSIKFWKKHKTKFVLIWVVLSALVLATFMTHSRSIFIWKRIPFLEFVQFPWRFLGISIFLVSFVGGSVIKNKTSKLIITILIAILILFNYGYFKAEHHYPKETDISKLTGKNLINQQKAAVLDYLPKTALTNPKTLAPKHALVLTGEAETLNFTKKSNYFFYDAKVYTKAQIAVPVIYFPGWKVFIENQQQKIIPTQELGLISISLEPGTYMVRGFFEETPFRIFSNMLSVITFIFIVVSLIWYKNRKRFLYYS